DLDQLDERRPAAREDDAVLPVRQPLLARLVPGDAARARQIPHRPPQVGDGETHVVEGRHDGVTALSSASPAAAGDCSCPPSAGGAGAPGGGKAWRRAVTPSASAPAKTAKL